MLLSISMRTRDGRAYAEALYSENKTIVKAGGKVHPTFNGQKSVKRLRDNEKSWIKKEIFYQTLSFHRIQQLRSLLMEIYQMDFVFGRLMECHLGNFLRIERKGRCICGFR